MCKTGLTSSNNSGPSIKDMQVLDEQSKAYFNFINSLTRTHNHYDQVLNLIPATLGRAGGGEDIFNKLKI